jgi:hypothetical protein
VPGWRFEREVAGSGSGGRAWQKGIDGFHCLKAPFAELRKAVTVEDFEALVPWRIALDRR